MKDKIIKLSEVKPWHIKQFKTFSRDEAKEIFEMAGIMVPDDWGRVVVMSSEDFQIAAQCVNASITAAQSFEKEETKPLELNSITVSW